MVRVCLLEQVVQLVDALWADSAYEGWHVPDVDASAGAQLHSHHHVGAGPVHRQVRPLVEKAGRAGYRPGRDSNLGGVVQPVNTKTFRFGHSSNRVPKHLGNPRVHHVHVVGAPSGVPLHRYCCAADHQNLHRDSQATQPGIQR